jgi:hypothetical protein
MWHYSIFNHCWEISNESETKYPLKPLYGSDLFLINALKYQWIWNKLFFEAISCFLAILASKSIKNSISFHVLSKWPQNTFPLVPNLWRHFWMTIDGLFDSNDHRSMINTGAILIYLFESETQCALNKDTSMTIWKCLIMDVSNWIDVSSNNNTVRHCYMRGIQTLKLDW